MSMICADLLYQLDLRLHEITQNEQKLFGGIAIFLMGDIMQLKPCSGPFIFDEPACEEFCLPLLCKPHWDSFEGLY